MNNGISNYINSMNQAGSTATNSAGKDTLLSNGAKNALALGNSSAGDVVTGEVVSINGKTVQIQMDNQRLITARLENKMEVAIGQSLAFEVKSNTNGQITLSPLFTNTTMNPAMIKAITQASLPLSEITINMTGTMMDNNLGIDRNSMQMMYALINEFSDADPSNLVSMKSLGIPINPENIEQFSAYKNNEHQLLSTVDDIVKDLGSMIKELPLLSTGEIIDIFNETDINALKEAFLPPVVEIEEEVIESQKEFVGPFGASFAEPEPVTENVQEEVVIPETMSAVENDTELSKLLAPALREEIAKDFEALGLNKTYIDSILDATSTPKEVLDLFRTAIELGNEGVLEDSAVKGLLAKEGIAKLLGNSIKTDWTINPEDGFSKERVRELYDRISKGAARLEEVLSQNGKESSVSATSAQSIHNNLTFMNDLNQLCQYIQIPLKFGEETAHGDLYVFTNKKKMASEDGEVSALLHLEMKTLGTMDIHVKLKDRNHVNTHFYLEDEKMMDFIEEHLGELDARLTERGYNNKSEASVKNKESVKGSVDTSNNEAVSTMLSLNKAKVVAKYSFDVRA